MSVSKSQCTVFFSVVLSTVFYSRSTAVFYYLFFCQYITLYHLLILCHYVHCCLVRCVHRMSVHHIFLSLISVTLSPLLSSRISPLSAVPQTLLFCVTMPNAVFWNLSNICQNHTLFRLLFLCCYVHSCILQSVQFLSYFTLYRLFVLCHNAHCCLSSPSIICQYLTQYSPFILCHNVHC